MTTMPTLAELQQARAAKKTAEAQDELQLKLSCAAAKRKAQEELNAAILDIHQRAIIFAKSDKFLEYLVRYSSEILLKFTISPIRLAELILGISLSQGYDSKYTGEHDKLMKAYIIWSQKHMKDFVWIVNTRDLSGWCVKPVVESKVSLQRYYRADSDNYYNHTYRKVWSLKVIPPRSFTWYKPWTWLG